MVTLLRRGVPDQRNPDPPISIDNTEPVQIAAPVCVDSLVFATVSIDLRSELITNSRGYKILLVITDRFFKFAGTVPLKMSR